jgi:hypothetical protein
MTKLLDSGGDFSGTEIVFRAAAQSGQESEATRQVPEFRRFLYNLFTLHNLVGGKNGPEGGEGG